MGSAEAMYSSHVLLSDDDGETWQLGGNIAEDAHDQSSEASLVERGNGMLLLNARNHIQGPSHSSRLLTGSADGGKSWLRKQESMDLVTPDCEGAMHVLRTKKQGSTEGGGPSLLQEKSTSEVILFTHPSTADRQDLMISLSHDGCRSWPSDKTVVFHHGSSGYSDLETLNDGTVLVFYETGLDGISLQSFFPSSL